MQDQIHCPKCGSTQFTANKKGFSGGKAVAGAVLTGGIGILAGTIGSNDIIITCLKCGNEFKPGDGNKPIPVKPEWKTMEYSAKEKRENNKDAAKKLWPVAFVISVICLCFQWWIAAGILGILGIGWLVISKKD